MSSHKQPTQQPHASTSKPANTHTSQNPATSVHPPHHTPAASSSSTHPPTQNPANVHSGPSASAHPSQVATSGQNPANTHPATQNPATSVLGDVFNAVWAADKWRITPFHETRFPANSFQGTYVVKICDAPRNRGASIKNHNLFKLHKWSTEKQAYEETDNKALLHDPNYKSYKLVYDLFDNYESDETKPEVNTKEECIEIMDFLNFVVDSEPLKVAASYLRNKFSNSSSIDREDKESFSNRAKFVNKLKKIWFDQYDWGTYKYYVDDSFDNSTGQDAIDFNRRLDDASSDDYVAIRFAQFVDVDHDGIIDGAGDSQLFKSFGSFFVGCSAECKIALGTVAYYEAKAAWAARRRANRVDDRGDDEEGVVTTINGHKYKLNMHRGGDRHQYCRSFFPEKV